MRRSWVYFMLFSVDSPQQVVKGSLQSLNMDAMLRHTFVPDYSVRAVTDVLYLAIKRTLYLAAKRATLMERSQKIDELGGSEPIDEEVEKVSHRIFFAHFHIKNVILKQPLNF